MVLLCTKIYNFSKIQAFLEYLVTLHFMFSEKATKCDEISRLIWHLLSKIQTNRQILVALENMHFFKPLSWFFLAKNL